MKTMTYIATSVLHTLINRFKAICGVTTSQTISNWITYMSNKSYSALNPLVDGTLSELSDPLSSYVHLEGIALPSSLKSISLPNCTDYAAYTFAQCTSLENLNLNKCSQIVDYTFASCSTLQTLALDNCESIGSHAFEAVGNIPLSLPKCTYIGDNNFSGITISLSSPFLSKCEYLGNNCFILESASRGMYFKLSECQHFGAKALHLTSSTGIMTVTMPKCTYIGASTFSWCRGISQVSAPLCSYIGADAFYECSYFGSGTFGAPQYIGDRALYDCHLHYVDFDLTNASYIGESAFYKMEKISRNYHTCPSLLFMGSNAFYTAAINGLTAANLPILHASTFWNSYLEYFRAQLCSRIEESAFYACTSLSDLSIPNCQQIDQYAMDGCYALSYISLPACTSIGACAFAHCSKLKTIYLLNPSQVCEIDSTTFSSTTLTSVYVPRGMKSLYLANTNWQSLSTKIVEVS